MKDKSYQQEEDDDFHSSPLNINVDSPVDNFQIGRVFKLFAAFIVLFAFFAIASKNSNGLRSLNGLSEQSFSSSTYEISVGVESPGYDSLVSLSMLPWDAIAEPAREQIISVSSFTVDGVEVDVDSGLYDITWTLGDLTVTGNTASFQIDTTGVRNCTVVISPSSRRKLGNHQASLITANGVSSSSTTTTTSSTTDTTTVGLVTDKVVGVDVGSTDVVGTTTTTDVTGILTDTTNTDVTDITTTEEETDSYTDSSSDDSYSYSFTLAVKYVRREVRSVTDEDRTRFLNALYLMYTTDEAEGKAAYGDQFNTAEYYVYKHLNGAGTTDCDHWHDGAGIVTHHMAFTLEVEQTLQAVDPSISMPYWEYAMDSYLYTNWWDSPLFDADWFGEANPSNDYHVIEDGGMWEGIEMPDGSTYTDWSIAETGSLNPFVNGYGQMRSPWNNNPAKGIGRHNQTYGMTQYSSMPSCSTMQSCFKSTTLADINDCLNGATHGPVHILIGGSWGEGDLFDDEDIEFVQMPDKLLFFKVLWRMGYTRCPSTCILGQPCKCAVSQEYIDEYGAYAILEATNVLYGLASDLVDASDELYLKVLRAVEDPGIAGEMFSSAAAYDPTFWPLHGAAERLVDLKRIMVSQGDITDFDETWAYTTYNKASGAAYLNGVCDWSKVAGSGDLTLPTCELDVICFGHNENDLLEFSGFLTDSDAYTNIEFYNLMHPWNDDLPYTYDTFDYDYCEDEGYAFDSTSSVVVMDPSMPVMDGPPSAAKSSGKAKTATSTVGMSKTSMIASRVKAGKPVYTGYGAGKLAPAKSTKEVSDIINTQPLAATKTLSDSFLASTSKSSKADTSSKSSSSSSSKTSTKVDSSSSSSSKAAPKKSSTKVLSSSKTTLKKTPKEHI